MQWFIIFIFQEQNYIKSIFFPFIITLLVPGYFMQTWY